MCAGGVRAQPYDKEYYYTRAQQYMSQGNLSGALEVYNTLIGLDPADAKAFNGRGLVYERRLDLNAAMIDYEHALELNPTYAEALHNRAALLQKYKNDKPPSVTFAPQGISRNDMIFNQTSLPQAAAGGQARPAAAQPYPYAAPQPAQAAASPQAAQTQGRLFTPPLSAAERARNEQWGPVKEEPPRYTPRNDEVTPGYFKQDTGYGADTRYLGPSNYQQPATASRVDGTLVRITPSGEQPAAPPPAPPVRPAKFPRPDDAGSSRNNPPVFDTTPSRPEGSGNYRQGAAATPRAATQSAAASRLPAVTAATIPSQSYIPPPSYTQNSAAGKSGAGQPVYGQTAAYPGNLVVIQSMADNTPAPSARISPLLVTQNQGAFPADGGRLLRDAWAYNNAGLALFNAGNYQQAIAEFDQAIKIAPHFALAYNNRGAAYAQAGQIRLAVDDFNNALRINPYYSDAQQNRELLIPILKKGH
jgi:tetratricopeptide (TPR) repeat protein